MDLSKIKVEQDIPLPRRLWVRGCTKLLLSLKLNESVFLPGFSTKKQAYVVTLANRANRSYKFTARTVVENGVAGMRVWRVQ